MIIDVQLRARGKLSSHISPTNDSKHRRLWSWRKPRLGIAQVYVTKKVTPVPAVLLIAYSVRSKADGEINQSDDKFWLAWPFDHNHPQFAN